jgi:hypothetical protein
MWEELTLHLGCVKYKRLEWGDTIWQAFLMYNIVLFCNMSNACPLQENLSTYHILDIEK